MKSGTVGLQMTRPVVAKKEKKKKVNRRHKSSFIVPRRDTGCLCKGYTQRLNVTDQFESEFVCEVGAVNDIPVSSQK